jgi:MoxR-like ATPase
MEATGALGDDRGPAANHLFGDEFLIKRPLLQALESDGGPPPVLLIDELDRADEEFEGFLLELLSDFQVTIPETGTIRATQPPVVVLTSNRTRELHDALKRRCLYYWIEYPDYTKELEIITTRVPTAGVELAEQVAAFVQELRRAELYKAAGVSETLDWVTALVALDKRELDAETINQTLGIVLKNQEDIQSVRGERVQEMLNRAKHAGT